jgi:hypothetical protein
MAATAKGVGQARPANPFLFGGARPAVLVIAEYAEHALAMDSQQPRDIAGRASRFLV